MKPPFDAAPTWLTLELAADPADRAILQRARDIVAAECAAAGANLLDVPDPALSALIARTAEAVRAARRAAAPFARADEPVSLSAEEAAARLGKSPWWVKQRCRRGDLPAWKVGRSWRVEPAALRAYAAGRVAR